MGRHKKKRWAKTKAHVSIKIRSPLATSDSFKPLKLGSIEEIRERDQYLRSQYEVIDTQLYGIQAHNGRRAD